MAHIGVASKSATLRAELKEWERAFAAANGGKKAGREDIKRNSVIGITRASSMPLQSCAVKIAQHGVHTD